LLLEQRKRTVTSEKRLMKRFPLRRMMLKARQHKSTNCWNLSPGLSPPFITYAMSDVSTNGVRSLANTQLHGLYYKDWLQHAVRWVSTGTGDWPHIGLSPLLIMYTMSDVSTNDVRLLRETGCRDWLWYAELG